MKKVGKTNRPFRYDLNQIPYNYTVEVTGRFKGLDLLDRVPDNYGLENRMDKNGRNNRVNAITKDIEEIKNKQTEMNNTIAEIKNTLEGTNSRITELEEQISELEDRMVEISAEEQNKGERMKRIEDSLRNNLWQY